MKNKVIIFWVLIFVITNCFPQSPSLSLLNSYSLTPYNNDTLGVFCRLIYHPARNKFYSVYACRLKGSTAPQGSMSHFAWREFDSNMNPTANTGTLSGFSSAGDFAWVQVDSTYFHLTSNGSNYKLTKFDDDFVPQGSVSIACGANDSKMDQLMNYANNRLVIGALFEPTTINPTFPMQAAWTPQVHLFQYNTSLTPVSPPQYLNPTYYSWGASAIFNSNKYYVVSMDSFPTYQLYSYEYDINWNYLARYPLSTDGQWSQGILWDGTYYYVAYHSGNEHRSGNIKVGIYDVNWNNVHTTQVTNNTNAPLSTAANYTNANRPYLTKVGTKLYVSYDEETYYWTPAGMQNYYMNFDWQARVEVYQINGITGISESEKINRCIVYPNPVTDQLTIKMNAGLKDIRYEISDINGRINLCGTGSEVSVKILESGLYFIKIINPETGTALQNGKFIRE